ncbi:phosphodiester glycosidase family protein [Bacillaceae bacterium SIJ1]|uniref:phosphodiester glycosidase family protein n=1 Tax=Litoribacterium kuwaitense TaxID=1398745 RepID=UPI0013ED19D3|nr:phosphodiester glycosidase family protein [Litoribacterium kuwaitense]NGP43777.1 phosphodiester glycosidase family protein [Litoribacterium kuwaitense]
MGKRLHLWLLFTFTPFLGFILFFYLETPEKKTPWHALAMEAEPLSQTAKTLDSEIDTTNEQIAAIDQSLKTVQTSLAEEEKFYINQQKQIASLTTTSQSQMTTSDKVLERILSNLLGDPISEKSGDRSTVKVYSLEGAGYRGYMAKVSVHSKDALRANLAHDKVKSPGETTSAAGKRTGATLAINAGGFWHTGDGDMAPMGITVIDGKIETMYESAKKLSFVGFNTSGHLVGGNYTTQKEIKDNHILHGASFTPTLLANGQKLPIPQKWANRREPRTIVGNFSNNDLLFIVIDGRQAGHSNGVSLEEVQNKLLSFQVKDAFNLDGGGSSAFYYNGQLMNKPSDGQERKVPSHILIFS